MIGSYYCDEYQVQAVVVAGHILVADTSKAAKNFPPLLGRAPKLRRSRNSIEQCKNNKSKIPTIPTSSLRGNRQWIVKEKYI